MLAFLPVPLIVHVPLLVLVRVDAPVLALATALLLVLATTVALVPVLGLGLVFVGVGGRRPAGRSKYAHRHTAPKINMKYFIRKIKDYDGVRL